MCKEIINEKIVSKLIIAVFSLFIWSSNHSVVSAHAYIINSNPSENEQLETSPYEITIEFNEKIQSGFASLSVFDSSGERVDKKNVAIDEKTQKVLKTDLEPNLTDDIYTIEWRVVSADGHSVSGIIPFIIGDLPEGVELPSQQYNVESSTFLSVFFNKVLLYTGLSLYMGILLFNLIWYRSSTLSEKLNNRTTTILKFALFFISVSVLSFIFIQTQANAGLTFLQSFIPTYLVETLKSTKEGKVWLIQMLLLIILLPSQYKMIKNQTYSIKKYWVIPGLTFIGILVSKAFIGHPSSSLYETTAIVLDFIHLTSASIWLGGIIIIIILLKEGMFAKEGDIHDTYWNTIQSYSTWALFSVAALAISGAINASILIPNFQSLVNTTYGITLLIKVALFFIMIIIGAYHLISRTMLHRRKLYKKSILLEMVIGVLLLLVTSVFTQLQTPTLLIDEPFYEEAEIANNKNLSLAISPKKTGIQNQFDVYLFDNRRNPLDEVEQLTINLVQENVEHTFTLEKTEEAHFNSKNLQLNQPGKWQVNVHLLTEDFESYDIPFEIQVR